MGPPTSPRSSTWWSWSTRRGGPESSKPSVSTASPTAVECEVRRTPASVQSGDPGGVDQLDDIKARLCGSALRTGMPTRGTSHVPRWPTNPYQGISLALLLVNPCCQFMISHGDVCNIILFQSPNIFNIIKTTFCLGSRVFISLITVQSQLPLSHASIWQTYL